MSICYTSFQKAAVEEIEAAFSAQSLKWWRGDPMPLPDSILPRAGNGAEERFLPGAVWVRESGQFTDAIVVGYGQYRQRSISGYLEGVLPLPMHAVRTYAGNLSDLVAGLQAVHRGRDGLDLSLKKVQRIVSEAADSIREPLTFPTCPACGERMPGAECQQPACAQVRKYVALRKLQDADRDGFNRFDATVRAEVARLAPRARVVTDIKDPGGACKALAWIEYDGETVKVESYTDWEEHGWQVQARDALLVLARRVVGRG